MLTALIGAPFFLLLLLRLRRDVLMLTAQRLTLSLGRRPVLHQLDLALPGGTVTGLIGPNGAGKTTLLRALAGILAVGAGTVALDDRPLARWPRRELARSVAYLAQDAPCPWPMTVRRIVALGRLPHLASWQRPGGKDEGAIAGALRAADVLHLCDRNVLTLSGGERARVMLARALARTRTPRPAGRGSEPLPAGLRRRSGRRRA